MRARGARPITLCASTASSFSIGGDMTVSRIGYGAMALTGLGGWGEPPDPAAAKAVLRQALELGVLLRASHSLRPRR